MEIVLQWLDDLDDLVFATLFAWRSLCRCCLAPGVVAAMILTPIYGADLGVGTYALATAVAAGSVLIWAGAATISMWRAAPAARATA